MLVKRELNWTFEDSRTGIPDRTRLPAGRSIVTTVTGAPGLLKRPTVIVAEGEEPVSYAKTEIDTTSPSTNVSAAMVALQSLRGNGELALFCLHYSYDNVERNAGHALLALVQLQLQLTCADASP